MINQNSHFRYGVFTISFLEIFYKVQFLETSFSSDTNEIFPSTSLNEGSIELKLKTDSYLSLNIRDTHLSFKFQFFKKRFIDSFHI